MRQINIFVLVGAAIGLAACSSDDNAITVGDTDDAGSGTGSVKAHNHMDWNEW